MDIIIGIIILAASFLFAMLGLGGGMVYVPVLNWAGYDLITVALPLGLLLNGLNTSFALIQFGRKKLVDWKGGAFMAGAALIGSPIGAITSKYVNQQDLKLIFALAVLYAAVRMLMQVNKKEPEEKAPFKKRIIIGIVIGLSIGFLGGLLGIGGGFIFAPVLMALGYKTKEAAATTAFVVTFSSFSGYLGHMADGPMNWTLTLILVVAVIIGSQFGARFMSNQAKPKMVKKIYAVVLIVIAIKFSWGAISVMIM
ncbi:MAG: sulfite exporter TauE/SafE family protein [Bacteroidetes bacterium]|nr:MAG: sulfite exporter TauE/SafE family protein [Bacteroidota bacterium]